MTIQCQRGKTLCNLDKLAGSRKAEGSADDPAGVSSSLGAGFHRSIAPRSSAPPQIQTAFSRNKGRVDAVAHSQGWG